MPFTKDQIISRTLTILGKGPITTVATGGNIAAALNEGFDFIYPKIVGETAWRFPVKIDELSSILNPNIPKDVPYTYIYQIPTDLLALWRLWPRNLDYQIYEDKIWANMGGAQAVWAEYRFLPKVVQLPIYFANYLAYALAADYAMPVTNNSAYIKVIKGEALQEKAIALATDSQQHPNRGIQAWPAIEVRGGGARRWR